MNASILISFIAQMISSGVILGMLWFLQIVHYPLLKKIKENFVSYEKESIRKILTFMTPWIIIDVLMNVVLCFKLSTEKGGVLIGMILALNILTWLITFFFQTDQQQELSFGFSIKSLKEVMRSSLVRTSLWSLKVILLAYYAWMVHY